MENVIILPESKVKELFKSELDAILEARIPALARRHLRVRAAVGPLWHVQTVPMQGTGLIEPVVHLHVDAIASTEPQRRTEEAGIDAQGGRDRVGKEGGLTALQAQLYLSPSAADFAAFHRGDFQRIAAFSAWPWRPRQGAGAQRQGL